MIFAKRAVLIGCIIFAGCLFGMLLQRLLPMQHLADAKTAITTIQSLMTLLLALVLGLLIGTSYGGLFAAAIGSADSGLPDPAARSDA